MRGRPADPNTNYKIALRVVGKYRYAATQPHVQMPDTSKTARRFVYWGEVTENLKFIPNDRDLLASEEERGKLIFPDTWDMSELDTSGKTAESIPICRDPYIENDGSAFSGTVSVIPMSGQFNYRLYGGTWFLW